MGSPTHSIEKPKDGLYNKYLVRKANNCAIDPRAEYFVLRLDDFGKDKKHIKACRKAIIAYAKDIKPHLPKLSADLLEKYS